MMADDERMNRLEERLAHHEMTVQELSDAMFEQQQRMDRLEALVKEMIDRLQSMSERGDGGTQVDEKPPHY